MKNAIARTQYFRRLKPEAMQGLWPTEIRCVKCTDLCVVVFCDRAPSSVLCFPPQELVQL